MSDSFEMLVDTEVSLGDAPAVCELVIDRLRRMKLIKGRLSKACVLGNAGYLPGPGVQEIFDGGSFWELMTCGVEPEIGRQFNAWAAFGPSFNRLTCPKCKKQWRDVDDPLVEKFQRAIENWMEETSGTTVACPKCKKRPDLNAWIFEPPLGLGNLSFRFWNWEYFRSDAWKVNLVDLVAEITGHRIVHTCGRL